MPKYNTDYRKELPEGAKPLFVKGEVCPNCGSRYVALPPDRIWCEKTECDTGGMALVGKGVYELELYQDA